MVARLFFQMGFSSLASHSFYFGAYEGRLPPLLSMPQANQSGPKACEYCSGFHAATRFANQHYVVYCICQSAVDAYTTPRVKLHKKMGGTGIFLA